MNKRQWNNNKQTTIFTFGFIFNCILLRFVVVLCDGSFCSFNDLSGLISRSVFCTFLLTRRAFHDLRFLLISHLQRTMTPINLQNYVFTFPISNFHNKRTTKIPKPKHSSTATFTTIHDVSFESPLRSRHVKIFQNNQQSKFKTILICWHFIKQKQMNVSTLLFLFVYNWILY